MSLIIAKKNNKTRKKRFKTTKNTAQKNVFFLHP